MKNTSQGAGGSMQASGEQADLARRIGRSSHAGALIASIPKWAAYAIIAWQAGISIEAMTGKRGIASLLERFGRQASYWEVVCWAAGIAGILFGLYSRHLLRKHTSRDASRLDALESRLDMILAASRVLPQGTPNSAAGH